MTLDGLFRSNFWDAPGTPFADGFQTLMMHMHNGKESLKEMQMFFERRAKIEEDYAKQLKALAREMPLGKTEPEDTKKVLTTVIDEMKHVAESHSVFSMHLTDNIVSSLQSLKHRYKEAKKPAEAAVLAYAPQVDSAVKKTKEKQDRYFSKVRDLSLSDESKTASVDKTVAEMQLAEDEYYRAALVAKEKLAVYIPLYEKTLDDLQKIETNRLEAVKSYLVTLSKYQSEFEQSYCHASDTLAKVSTRVSPQIELQRFVISHRTSSVPINTQLYKPIHSTIHGKVVPPRHSSVSGIPFSQLNTLNQISDLSISPSPVANVEEEEAKKELLVKLQSALPNSLSISRSIQRELSEVSRTIDHLSRKQIGTPSKDPISPSPVAPNRLRVDGPNRTRRPRSRIMSQFEIARLMDKDDKRDPEGPSLDEVMVHRVDSFTSVSDCCSSCSSGIGDDDAFLVRAIADYDADVAEDLTFRVGDTLEIFLTLIEKGANPGWWYGRHGNDFGLVPSTFVERLD